MRLNVWNAVASVLLVFVFVVATACSSGPSAGGCVTVDDPGGLGCAQDHGCCTNFCSAGACQCAGTGGSCAEDNDCCDLSEFCNGFVANQTLGTCG